jgi:hypothetical protein
LRQEERQEAEAGGRGRKQKAETLTSAWSKLLCQTRPA